MRLATAIFRAGTWALGFAVSSWALLAEVPGGSDGDGDNWPAVRDATFRMVWGTVNESYFDPTFGGVDWAAVGEQYARHLPEVTDKRALRGLLQAMLGELRKTHFAIQPREMAVFSPEERRQVGTTGLTVAFVDGRVAVSEVAPGSAAAQAGLRPGDLLIEVDGKPLAVWWEWLEQADLLPARRALFLKGVVEDRLRGPVGSTVALVVAGPDGVERGVELAFGEHLGVWSEPMGTFPSQPVVVRRRCEPDGLAYLHFNVFARAAMKDIRALLREVPAAGGLVIDLRGNGGGLSVMASGISGWLSDRAFELGVMHLRQGHLGFRVTPQAGAFLGPVAVLIDSGSASTSEIMAAGLQEAGRARVFGEPSPGAALPSLFKALPTGDLLQHAIADMQTPRGITIEGHGVIPDEIIRPTTADLAAGRDPVLAGARRWIEQQRRLSAGTTSPL